MYHFSDHPSITSSWKTCPCFGVSCSAMPTVQVFLIGSIKHGSWFQQNNLTFQEIQLITYMFAARCKAQGVSQFAQFLAIVASTDWSSRTIPARPARHHVTSSCWSSGRNVISQHTYARAVTRHYFRHVCGSASKLRGNNAVTDDCGARRHLWPIIMQPFA